LKGFKDVFWLRNPTVINAVIVVAWGIGDRDLGEVAMIKIKGDAADRSSRSSLRGD
jgi:hypothetical protein